MDATTYIYGNGLQIASVNDDGGTTYNHHDHLGGISATTDESSVTKELLDYYPYGETFIDETYSTDANSRYTYTGKELDDTGLYYFEARYYSPQVGRFASQDPAVYDARVFPNQDTPGLIADPQALNPYAYCKNNPLGWVDTDGQEPNKAQAGTIEDILNIFKMPYSYSIGTNNLRAIRDAKNFYIQNSTNTTRYVYTEKAGWIDMKHFFYFAEKSYQYGNSIAEFGAYASETYQWLGYDIDSGNSNINFNIGENSSAFSYEDLTSDKLGIFFGYYAKNMENSGYSTEELLDNFFTIFDVTNPQNAENYDELPYDSTNTNTHE